MAITLAQAMYHAEQCRSQRNIGTSAQALIVLLERVEQLEGYVMELQEQGEKE